MSAEKLLNWFDKNKRALPWRGVNNPYYTWLSEVMLQQTTVKTVVPYFNRFTQKWPTVQDLSQATQQDVLREWAGLGYYSRARNLHSCAAQLANHFPTASQELIKLKGIGPYASAAIAAICFNERIAVVDGNVERVISRFYALENTKEVRAYVQALVPIRAGDFAESLMELGALVCTPKNPKCHECPLKSECRAENPLDFPVKKPKPPRPEKHETVYVVQRENGAILLFTRPQKGLLAGMAELPFSKPFEGNYTTLNTQVRHVFTHFTLTLTICTLLVPDETQAPQNGRFVQDLNTEAIPTLFKKVLALLGKGV